MVNQLPKGWKEEELGKHANIKRGSTITKKQVVHGDYPVVAGGKEAAYYHNEYNRQPPVITVSGSGASAGYVNYWEVPIFASDCCTIEEKDLNIKYIYYFLKSRQQELLDKQVGVAIPHVSPKDVSPLLIPYPTDKGEQKYIVDTLDAVAEMIRLRKETIQLTKDLIPAIFHEMFGDPITNPKGWDKKNLGQVCDVRSGNAFPERYQGYTNGKPFYKVGDISRTIEENHIYLDKAKNYITDEIAQIIKAKSFSKNTIVFAKVGEALRLNRRALISKDAFIDNNVMGVSIKEDCNDLHYLYLYYHFVCNINLNFIKKEGAIPSVNNKDINNLYLPIPPLSLQKDFAKKVEQINDYIIAQQEELEQFETLFQSLLQEAFTGVLTWKYPRKECHDKKDK